MASAPLLLKRAARKLVEASSRRVAVSLAHLGAVPELAAAVAALTAAAGMDSAQAAVVA